MDDGTSRDSTPRAVQDCHALLVWLVPHLHAFPRLYRYTLGERLEQRLLAVLERLVEAAYRRDRQAVLARANLDIDIARHLWRVAFELKVIPMRRYAHGAQLLTDLGRQVGGWRKGRPATAPGVDA